MLGSILLALVTLVGESWGAMALIIFGTDMIETGGIIIDEYYNVIDVGTTNVDISIEIITACITAETVKASTIS